jgi:hypothetical protein
VGQLRSAAQDRLWTEASSSPDIREAASSNNPDRPPAAGLRVLIVKQYGQPVVVEGVLEAITSFLGEEYEGEVVIEETFFNHTNLDHHARLLQQASLVVVSTGQALDRMLLAPVCTGILIIAEGSKGSSTSAVHSQHEDELLDRLVPLWQQWQAVSVVHGNHSLNASRSMRQLMQRRRECRYRFGFDVFLPGSQANAAFGGGSSLGGLRSPWKLDSSSIQTLSSRAAATDEVNAGRDVILRVELSSSGGAPRHWFEVVDLWTFDVSSSSPFLLELHRSLEPYMSRLLFNKHVLVVDSADGFVPVLSFLGRCRSLTIFEHSSADSAEGLLELFRRLFKETQVFFQHFLPVDVHVDKSKFIHSESDTLVVMNVGSLSDLFDCDPCSLLDVVSDLSDRTRQNLVLEFIPICIENNCSLAIAELETSIKQNFETFSLAGVITATGSFIYVCETPLRHADKKSIVDTIQGVIISPSNGSTFAVNDTMAVEVLCTGPPEVIEYLRALRVEEEVAVIKEQAGVDAIFSPRLFVGERGISLSGCNYDSVDNCFGSFSVAKDSGVYYIRFDPIPLRKEGIYEVSFQITKFGERIFKAHFTPELVTTDSIIVYTVGGDKIGEV